MNNESKKSVLCLKYIDGILNQRILIEHSDGKSEEKWEPIEGQPQCCMQKKEETSLSDRFSCDTEKFRPHDYSEVKDSNLTRKLKVNIDFIAESKDEKVLNSHIERSIRMNNVLKKLLKSPDIIMKDGFDFKGNEELKRAITFICIEMGSPWEECTLHFR